MKKRKFAIRGRYFILPELLPIEYPYIHRRYEPVDFRCPRKGESFVSGVIPEIFFAPNDLSQEYLVVRVLESQQSEPVPF